MSRNFANKNLRLLSKFFFFYLSMSVATYAQTTFDSPQPTVLIIKPKQITVNGKTASVYTIEQPDGTWGYRGIKGQQFNVILKNQIKEPTVVHWHGLILPNSQDGVPLITQPLIEPGSDYRYQYPLTQSGTFWMHSHYAAQLQQQLSAPFIITDPNEPKRDEQDVIMFLSDFSFKSTDQIWKQLRENMQMPMNHNGNSNTNMQHMNMSMSSHEGMSMNMDHSQMANMQHSNNTDLNDVAYDAYLTNYRTLDNPEIIRVTPEKSVRLRIIGGAAATNFFVNLGALQAEVIAFDGELVKPFKGSVFTLAMGQRIDLRVILPNREAAYPILAQGEGTRMQTGLILATPHAKIPKLSQKAKHAVGAVTPRQEFLLHAINSLKPKKVDKRITLTLEGNMQTYVWKINGEVWPKITPIKIKQGDRIEMIFKNNNGMSHPMHLHGHVFQVTEINGKPLRGALRDTVLIPANGTVKVQFDAGNTGKWLIHCHVLYHGQGGMMTLIDLSGADDKKS